MFLEEELRQAPASESAEASTSRGTQFPEAGAAEEGEEGEGASLEEGAPASPGDSSIATIDILLAASRRAGAAEEREEEEEGAPEEEASISSGETSIATIDYFRWIPEHREDPDAALTPEGSEEGRNALFDEWLEGEEGEGASLEEEAPASPGDSSIATMDIMLASSRRAGVAEEREEEEASSSGGETSIATIDYFRWIPEHREDPDAALTPEGSEEGPSARVNEWLEEAAVLGAAADAAGAEDVAAGIEAAEEAAAAGEGVVAGAAEVEAAEEAAAAGEDVMAEAAEQQPGDEPEEGAAPEVAIPPMPRRKRHAEIDPRECAERLKRFKESDPAAYARLREDFEL
ncbi:unnamed protein product [Gongylonema pulchrum]|uniref:SIT4 phosphatase-associated protein n=1 Tax=Gongylonema pulchrum TaxID=637853 RepID=A0A183D533_9BILA|nr:unnamed protein product [Gongylonema pulchrum]